MEPAINPKLPGIRGGNIRVFIPFRTGLPFDHALPLVERAGLVMVSSRRLNKVIGPSGRAQEHSESCESSQATFAYWSGTLAAYAKPGEKFGKFIFYTDPQTSKVWAFPTGQYEGATNSILVVEHPNYVIRMKDNYMLVVPHNPASVGIVENFPEKDGWHDAWDKNILHYPADKNYFDYPCPAAPREAAGSPSYQTYLYRIEARVGPVACGQSGDAYLNIRPSVPLGVVVEKPPGDDGCNACLLQSGFR